MQGAKIIEGVSVTGVLRKIKVTGVNTHQRHHPVRIRGELRHGPASSANSPASTSPTAAEHIPYTEDIKGMPANMPVLEDPSSYGYFRDEVGGP